MASEIISNIANFVRDTKEYNRFRRFFLPREKPNGILTKQGGKVSPLTRGLITAKNSFPIVKSFLLGDTLSEEEQQRIKHAILFSFRGTYYINNLPEEIGTRVGITLENNDAHTYLSNNTNSTLAFLDYFDGRSYRCKESSSIKTYRDNDDSRVVFDFPQIKDIPTTSSRLYIYTRPISAKNIDRRFTKMILLLGI